jgi:predicted nucleic acid-binding protein
MKIVKVVCDANVLYSAALRDLLMELGVGEVFEPRWTEEIHEEWIRNVLLNNRNLTSERLTRTKNMMNATIKNCLVQDYETIIQDLEIPDPGDRHVLAAAIHSRSKFIITFNLRDFPEEVLAPYDILAQHPDDFILHLLDLNWQTVCKAAEKQRIRLKNPPKTPDEYLETLIELGLPLSATRMRELCYAD